MADVLGQGEGAIRRADATLRAAGGRMVLLRLAGSAAANDDAEQLGLATPGFRDVELAPATWHKASSVTKLLVSGSAVHAVVGSLGFDSAEVLFETAVGVVIDEVVYRITDSFAAESMGVAYCYWLVLERPVR
jgi:hypothetical protein